MQIRCCALLARKAAVHVVFTNHSQVSFYCSLPHSTPRNTNFSLLLFSDFGTRFLVQVLGLELHSTRKPSFGHFRLIQGLEHVGLYELYLISLPWHNSRHVGNLQEFSCCFWKWDSAITSTIYAYVVSTKVIDAVIFHSCEPLSWILSTTIPQLTTVWCLTSWTVWTNALVDHAHFLLHIVINWTCSSRHVPAIHYMVSWPLFMVIWI